MDEVFRAGTQYDDLTGTCAADRTGIQAAAQWLDGKVSVGPDEFVVGIEAWAGEDRGSEQNTITVHFLIIPGSFDSSKHLIDSGEGISPRRVTVDMAPSEFLGLFKRFSLALSPGGMLTGKNYSYTVE